MEPADKPRTEILAFQISKFGHFEYEDLSPGNVVL